MPVFGPSIPVTPTPPLYISPPPHYFRPDSPVYVPWSSTPDPPSNSPQPYTHLEGDWIVNLNYLNRRQHDVMILIGLEDKEAAPFFCYDFNTGFPEILMTRGQNCHVYVRFLHTRPWPYPCKALTRKQRLLFQPQEHHTPLIDWALNLEKDVTLRAEVQHYRYNIKTSREISLQLAMLKEEYNNTWVMVHQSAKRLAAANAAAHIMGCIVEEVTKEDHLLQRILEPGMQSLNCNSEPLHYEKRCGWCQKPSYDVIACSMLH